MAEALKTQETGLKMKGFKEKSFSFYFRSTFETFLCTWVTFSRFSVIYFAKLEAVLYSTNLG